MLTYKVIIGAAAVFAFAFSVWLNVALHRERKELEIALEASQARVEQLRADMQRQAEALFEREKKITSLANDKYRLSKQLKEAADREQEVKLWIDTRVPDAVSGMLRCGASNSDDPAATADSVQ